MTAERQMRFWLIGLVLFLAVLYLLKGILLPFVAGMAMAYFLDPLADRLEAWGASRTVATSAITAAFVLALLAGLFLLVPILQTQIGSFIAKVPGYVQAFTAKAEPMVAALLDQLAPAEVEKIKAAVGDQAGTVISWVGRVLGGLLSGGAALLSLLSLVIVTPVVIFYMLRDWDHMVALVDGWVPRPHRETIRKVIGDIDETLAGFVRGQAMVCLTLATLYGLGLTLIGLDIGLVVGIVAGIISFIPYVGSISGMIIALGLALAQFPTYGPVIAVAVLFTVGQLLESNVLTPKLVGERVKLHAVWIMFALLAGGAMLGFVGVLLAVPVAAVVGVLVRFSLDRYLESPLYLGPPKPPRKRKASAK